MSKEDYTKKLEGVERRFIVAPVTITERGEDENGQATVEGYAALFNSRADLGWFTEEIMAGAFDDVLDQDVRCLFNHDPNLILARTASGTLSLSVDEKGLKFSYVTPNRSFGADLEDMINSGDVSQCSFAFSVLEEAWNFESDVDHRQVIKVNRLLDVSPVTYPAYTDTSLAARSAGVAKKENTNDPDQDQQKNEPFNIRGAQLLINKNKSTNEKK